MSMNKLEVLKETLKQWTWMRDNKVYDKFLYFRENGIDKTPLHFCYCCHYSMIVEVENGIFYNLLDCDICPLYSNYGDAWIKCQFFPNPYKLYIESKNSLEKCIAVHDMVELIEEKIEEVENE